MDADMTVELEELGKDLESARDEEKESEETKQFRSFTFCKKSCLQDNMCDTDRKLFTQRGAEVWNGQVQDIARGQKGKYEEEDRQL